MSNIKELAKELCEKSGCHHKCHDTKDCVVEDEALLLINENKSNNFEVKSNNSQCIDCIHNDICQFYKALGATVICYPCGFYEAKSNEELFKQALVEGVNRRIDKTIEIEVITYEQDRFNHFINLMEKAQKSYDRLYKRYKDSPYLFEGTTLLSDAGRELQFYKDVIAMLGQGNQKQSEGKWEYHECVSSYEGTVSGYACSCCKAFVDDEVFEAEEFHKNYCGNCGSKMKGQ